MNYCNKLFYKNRQNLPTFVLPPSSEMFHNRTWLPNEMATIFEASPEPLLFILAFIAILSMHASICGLVKINCQPLESFNLKNKLFTL